MELLKEIAKDKLVIMVTHNPELAKQYSTRIVKLLDGKIVDDSNPFKEEEVIIKPEKREKISMSFLTALALSFNNLRTKKGRTLLTSFAGSLGIIGIALILALSRGKNIVKKLLHFFVCCGIIQKVKMSVSKSGATRSLLFVWRGGFKMAAISTVERVKELVKEPIEALGLTLWDIRFVKEGASWYLRIFIDNENGVSINDCTDVSHAIDPILDEADPIENSYYLEVCSPGLGRELRSEEHFKRFIGSEINVTLYKAIDKNKNFRGVLTEYNNGPVLEIDGEKLSFSAADVAKATLCDE